MTLTLILTLKHNMSHLSSQVDLHRKVVYVGLHMVIIKFHQVLIENDRQLDINAKRDLESHKKIRNEFIDPIMCRKVVPYMI